MWQFTSCCILSALSSGNTHSRFCHRKRILGFLMMLFNVGHFQVPLVEVVRLPCVVSTVPQIVIRDNV